MTNMENVITLGRPDVQAAQQHEQLVYLSEADQAALGEASLAYQVEMQSDLETAMAQARAIAAATPHRVTSGNAVGMARVEGKDIHGNSLQLTTFDFTKEDYAKARRVEHQQQVLQGQRQAQGLYDFMKSREKDDDNKETVDA
jgi:hypothetical protein